MTRQTRVLIALVLTCFGLLSCAVWLNSGSAIEYREDLEYYNRKCKAERQSKEGEYKKDCQRILYRTLDDPVALLTGGLAIATIALFAVTYLLYAAASRQGDDAKEAIRAARRSAKAAKRSAKAAEQALLGLERPYLFIELDPSADPIVIGRGDSFHMISFSFRNFGRTPAITTFLDAEFTVAPSMPNLNVFSIPESLEYFEGEVIESGGSTLSQKLTVGLSDLNRTRLADGEAAFYLYGRVSYRDVFGKALSTSFCFAMHRGTRGRFIRTGEGNSHT